MGGELPMRRGNRVFVAGDLLAKLEDDGASVQLAHLGAEGVAEGLR